MLDTTGRYYSKLTEQGRFCGKSTTETGVSFALYIPFFQAVIPEPVVVLNSHGWVSKFQEDIPEPIFTFGGQAGACGVLQAKIPGLISTVSGGPLSGFQAIIPEPVFTVTGPTGIAAGFQSNLPKQLALTLTNQDY